MQILHIYKDYAPVIGGIENHIRALAEGQAARGHDGTVLVSHAARGSSSEPIAGVQVIRAGRLAHVASTPLGVDMIRQAARLHPHVVHLHMPFPPGDLAAQVVGGSPPLVVTYHSDIVRQRRLLQVYRPLLHATLRRSARIIATSEPYIYSSPILRRYASKCRVVPLSVDPERFADGSRASAIRQRLLESTDGCLILAVGVLRYYKGLHILLGAMTQLDATLVIVGAGPEESRLKDLAQAFGVARRVHFAERVTDADLPSYYHAANVFVLPSHLRAEAFGVVQLEAMAAGLPVISTELGTGTSVVNQHGVTGFVVPPGDPLPLARALRVLVENPDLRRHMGDSARARVVAEYTHDRMIDRVQAVYDESRNQ